MKATHEGPNQLAAHSNPQHYSKDMDRENLPTDEYIDLASEAAAIAAGDVVATQVFDYVDENVLAGQFDEGSAVRKGVNILGPGLVGALVFTMSDNQIVERVAVGHALTTVRRGIDEGMSLVTGNNTQSDTGTSGTKMIPSASESLQGRMLTEAGTNAAVAAGGTGGSSQTMIQGG